MEKEAWGVILQWPALAVFVSGIAVGVALMNKAREWFGGKPDPALTVISTKLDLLAKGLVDHEKREAEELVRRHSWEREQSKELGTLTGMMKRQLAGGQ